MKPSKALAFLLLSLTAHAFAGPGQIGSADSNNQRVNVTLDQILSAKRVVISPVQYKGYLVRAEPGANKLCQFLGYSRAETYSSSILESSDKYKTVTIDDFIHVDNEFAYNGVSTYFKSVTCLK